MAQTQGSTMGAKKRDKTTAFHNPEPSGDFPKNATKDEVRKEFGKRLSAAMHHQGLNQSELARRAAKHMPDGKFGRDSVSGYVRGVNLAGPLHLGALCKALNVKPHELVPEGLVPSVENPGPKLDVTEAGDGKARLKINQIVDWPVALEVMKLLKG